MITLDQIRTFLADRPLLTQRGISLESGVSDSLLGKILRGERSMTPDVAAKLEPVLKKYGFN
jgi:plasmid maintenance system antidote protein VapI